MQPGKATDKHNQLSAYYKALSHPARLAIIEMLLYHKACTCNGFVIKLPFAQATISEHLRKLKQAGLVSVTEKGSSSEYRVNKQAFRRFMLMQMEMKIFE
jgi:ArsR family transcriptional regulator, arsenate/arsenite/antimonite-responsive transcriptional repressor